MDARKFWTMCRLHDWFYYMSDDPGVFREGQDSEDALIRIAEQDPACNEVYEAWRKYHYDSGPKPDEPKIKD